MAIQQAVNQMLTTTAGAALGAKKLAAEEATAKGVKETAAEVTKLKESAAKQAQLSKDIEAKKASIEITKQEGDIFEARAKVDPKVLSLYQDAKDAEKLHRSKAGDKNPSY